MAFAAPRTRYEVNYSKYGYKALTKKPVLEAFWSWLDQQKPVRNTRMDEAIKNFLCEQY